MTSWEELDAAVDALRLHPSQQRREVEDAGEEEKEEDFSALSDTSTSFTSRAAVAVPHAVPSPSPWTRLFAQPSPSPPPSSTAASSLRPPLSSSLPIVLPTVHKQPIIGSAPHPSTSPPLPSSSSSPFSASPAPPSSSSASALSPASSPSPSSPSVSHLILDSGAFISGASLTTYGPSCVYLTPTQVPLELRDESSLHRYRTFPFPILTRQPSADAVAAVTRFAQLTGDATSLSVTDLLVLALAWQVEREVNGTTHLKDQPSPINEQAVLAIINGRGRTTALSAGKPGTQDKEDPHASADIPGWDDDSDEAEDDSEEEQEQHEDEGVQGAAGEAAAGVAAAAAAGDDDGEGQWVTPDNLHEQADNGARQRFSLAHPSSVATITTDYAVQNVMLQLGLRLISVSGLSITSTRQFLHKCHACFHITRDMTRLFCPACGLHTLIRCTLVVDTDAEGRVIARMFHGRRHLSTRGTRYSIPRPKGGRGGGGLKLAEDVMEGFGRGGVRKEKGGGVEGLYEKGVEFGVGQSGRRTKVGVVGYGRKNPNEVAKRTGNRKRRQ